MGLASHRPPLHTDAKAAAREARMSRRRSNSRGRAGQHRRESLRMPARRLPIDNRLAMA
jgi:hypothetical protein